VRPNHGRRLPKRLSSELAALALLAHRDERGPPVERTSDSKELRMTSTILGIVAASWAVLMGLSPLLQIREILRRGSSAGVSIRYFEILFVGFALWIAYGFASADLPLIVPNCVALLVTASTIAVARTYG
jgi:MtN3 and saliva related transmembrane protein